MKMTSKKGIAKCPGNAKLSIFSTGNFELYCVIVITWVVSSVGGMVKTKTPFAEHLFLD